MESAEKTLSEMVSATDFDTTRFFVEEDKSAQRDPEAIVQEMKAKRQEIEDFYTKVCCCFSDKISSIFNKGHSMTTCTPFSPSLTTYLEGEQKKSTQTFLSLEANTALS